MRLGIEITSKCNASCAHCSAACGPSRKEGLTTEEVFRLMDEAAALGSSPLEFSITGGEPFLDREQLRDVIAHGTSLGAIVSCISNAFWARSPQRAIDVLAPLHAAGLRMIGISTSRYHQQYVPAECVRNAIEGARRWGIRSVLKQALVRSDLAAKDSAPIEAAAALADEVERFAVIGSGRSATAIPDDDRITQQGIPLGRCPSTDMMVATDGRVLACCTSGPIGTWLDMGNIRREPFAIALNRLDSSAIQRRLRQSGPASLLPAVILAGHGDRLRPTYLDACDLCTHLASDPLLSAAAQAEANRDVHDPS